MVHHTVRRAAHDTLTRIIPSVTTMRTTLAFMAFSAFLAVYGCSSGSSSSSQTGGGGATPSTIGGIWRGKAQTTSGSTVDSLLIVSEDGRFISTAQDSATQCAAVAQGSVNTSGAAFTGGGNFGQIDYMTVPAAQTNCSFSDGSVWGTSAVSGTFVSRTSLSLSSTNTTALGAVLPVDPIAYTFDMLYNESSDLAKTAGNWTGQTGSVISIDANGVIFSQDAKTGCVLNGQMTVINPAYDAYSVTVTFSNCDSGAAGLNGGTAIGLAALDDLVTPNQLYVGYTLTLSTGESFMVATVATR